MDDDDRDDAGGAAQPRCPHCGRPLQAAGSDDRPVWECPDDGYISIAP